jgi:hypothetical protein
MGQLGRNFEMATASRHEPRTRSSRKPGTHRKVGGVGKTSAVEFVETFGGSIPTLLLDGGPNGIENAPWNSNIFEEIDAD